MFYTLISAYLGPLLKQSSADQLIDVFIIYVGGHHNFINAIQCCSSMALIFTHLRHFTSKHKTQAPTRSILFQSPFFVLFSTTPSFSTV